MKILRFITLLLVIVGALNWGLWGIFQYDVIAHIFSGNTSGWARFVYSIIGLFGIYGITFFFVPEIYKCCCICSKKPHDKEKKDE